MTVVEIVLIIIGIVVFILSFVLPEKKGVLSEETVKLSEETIKKMVDEEMKGVREKVEETVDETVSYAIEKTERSMERLSNEKIMAVNEYSDTVLNEIHKNHQEVVFLYDMLNDKQVSLKQAVSDAEKCRQEVEKANRIKDNTTEKPKMVEQEEKVPVEQPVKQEEQDVFTPFVVEKLEIPKKPAKKTTAKQTSSKQTSSKQTKKPATTNQDDSNKTKNEMILSMHEEGKSNMAIAKELSLGIGEVKLIIDLYKGGLK